MDSEKMDAVVETEKLIRGRLESSGQLAKMRAMVVEASLKAITSDGKDADSLFTPSSALLQAKKGASGLKAIAIVADYLQFLGLSYTASVLFLETGIKATDLSRPAELRTDPNVPAIVSLLTSPVTTPPVAAVAVSAPVALAKPPVPSVTPVTEAPKATVSAPAAAKLPPKPKSVDTLYEIAEWENKDFLRFDQVAGQQVQLWKLTNCNVSVYDALDSMTVDEVVGGELVLAACEGSLFLRDCKDMVVYAACKQLRLRDCVNMDIRLFSSTDPVVESSHHITIKPFNLRIPRLISSFKAARLDPATNRFVHVYDFTADNAKIPQPHFTVVFPDHGLQMKDVGADVGIPECPQEIEDLLLGKLAPAASSESGQNKSHNIKTGASTWTAAPKAESQSKPVAVPPIQLPVVAIPAVVPKPVDVKPIPANAVDVKPIDVKPVEAPKTAAVPQAKVAEPADKVLPVPKPTATATAPAATAAAADDQYSSYSESSDDEDEKYEVDEDDDEF